MAIETTENPNSTQGELTAVSPQRIDDLKELIAGAEKKIQMWGHEPAVDVTTTYRMQEELGFRIQGMKDALDLITGKTNLNSTSLRELRPRPVL